MNGAGALLACIADRWTPGIGDPHPMGWATVAAYAVCAVLAAAVASRASGNSGRMRTFWIVVAILMVALAINKQLDFQSALTAAGRCISKAQGWYAERRGVQRLFILALIATSALVLLVALYAMRRELRRNFVAMAGLFFVATFVLVRAIGFHGFDALLGTTVHDIRMNWILELSGLALISLNAAVLLATRDRPGVTRR